MSVNSDLRDRAIRHALALSRYSAGLSQDIVKLLNSADQDIVDRIAASVASIDDPGIGMSRSSRKRLAQALDGIRALNSAIYAQVSDKLLSELTDLGDSEASFQAKSLTTAVPIEVAVSVPPPARMAAIITETPMEGRLLSSWLDQMEAGRIDRVNQAIRLGMISGDSTDEIVRRIRGTKAANFSDGVLDISRRSAQSIVRTAVTHTSNVAAQETWRAAHHVVKAWQFLATLDSRTTITCASLDGQVFPIGQGPIPPRHVRCRSISVAVTKSFKEMGVELEEIPVADRASMDGQVAGGTTFDGWLREKDTAIQDKVLGKTRADLFRKGKLDLSDFIRGDGSVLTLDELKQAHRDILG